MGRSGAVGAPGVGGTDSVQVCSCSRSLPAAAVSWKENRKAPSPHTIPFCCSSDVAESWHQSRARRQTVIWRGWRPSCRWCMEFPSQRNEVRQDPPSFLPSSQAGEGIQVWCVACGRYISSACGSCEQRGRGGGCPGRPPLQPQASRSHPPHHGLQDRAAQRKCEHVCGNVGWEG